MSSPLNGYADLNATKCQTGASSYINHSADTIWVGGFVTGKGLPVL
jgi:hypothetical protein